MYSFTPPDVHPLAWVIFFFFALFVVGFVVFCEIGAKEKKERQ